MKMFQNCDEIRASYINTTIPPHERTGVSQTAERRGWCYIHCVVERVKISVSILLNSKMSLLPYVMNIFDSLEYLNERESSLFNQNFGLGIFEEDLQESWQVFPRRQRYVRPWRRPGARQSGFSRVENNRDTFKIHLDVGQFKPEEIHVKLIGNNIVVNGKHEERADEHGQIAREFERRYYLPRTVDKDAITSTLSSDGILIIEAPKKPLPPPEEREIAVTQTDTPARIQKGRRQRAISQ